MSYQTEEKLPFFVYGTLGSYPSMIRATEPRSRVYGEVITPAPHRYESLLQSLDHLEEYDPANPDESWYVRIPYEVQLNAHRTERAWLYLGRARHLKMSHKRIINGDWAQYWEHNGQQPFTGRS